MKNNPYIIMLSLSFIHCYWQLLFCGLMR